MLQEELKVTAFNKKKIMSEWRRIMRIAKTDELKREIEIYSQNHEREVDAKDAILQMLDRDLEEAEEQYQTALRNHLIHVDKLLALQDARLQGLGEEFKRDLDIILEEFRTERQEIVENHRMEMKELLDIMQAVEEEEKKKQDEAKSNHDSGREETKNKNSEDLVTLNTKLGMIAEKVERDFEHQYSNYEQNTKQMAEEYSSMYAMDKKASEEIKKLHRKIDYLNEEIASWKYKTQQNMKECQARNDALRREKANVLKHYQELKKKMTQFRENEIRKLSKLTTDSRNCTLKLREFVAMGEQILKLAELCRKLEDEKEKVLPFYASDAEAKAEEQRYLQQDREQPSATQGESVQFDLGEGPQVDSEIMRLLNPDVVYEEFRELEVFYKRFNKVLLDKLACENKKKALEKENKFFKNLLKQYLDGVSVNEDVMTQANPLFVVNNRIQLNRPPVEREGRQTVVEAAHVVQIRARAAM